MSTIDTDRPRSATPTRSSLGALYRLQVRELVRNYSYFLFVVAFPFLMMGLFLGMQEVLSASAPPGEGPDFSATAVPMGVFLAVTGVALTTTAGPLAEYRQHGTLRVLGTTPVSRRDFIVTHLLVRVVVAVLLAVGVTLVGAVLGIVPWSAPVAVVPAALGGLAIYLGLGYLLGGTVANGQLATNLATLVQISTLFLTGVALPFDLLPPGLADTLAWLPTGQFGDLLLWAMDSPLQHHAWWQSLAYALAVGAVLVAAAVRLFRWDAQAR